MATTSAASVYAASRLPMSFWKPGTRLGVALAQVVVLKDAAVGIAAGRAGGLGLIGVGAAHTYRKSRRRTS
jgi:sugar-phosphatase